MVLAPGEVIAVKVVHVAEVMACLGGVRRADDVTGDSDQPWQIIRSL